MKTGTDYSHHNNRHTVLTLKQNYYISQLNSYSDKSLQIPSLIYTMQAIYFFSILFSYPNLMKERYFLGQFKKFVFSNAV